MTDDEVRKVRREAFEEAARLVEGDDAAGWVSTRAVAAAIRALGRKTPTSVCIYEDCDGSPDSNCPAGYCQRCCMIEQWPPPRGSFHVHLKTSPRIPTSACVECGGEGATGHRVFCSIGNKAAVKGLLDILARTPTSTGRLDCGCKPGPALECYRHRRDTYGKAVNVACRCECHRPPLSDS